MVVVVAQRLRAERALQSFPILHYNSSVRFFRLSPCCAALVVGLLLVSAAIARAQQGQQAPAASGARILLVPRRLVSGERATLAVLDYAGRLTPGVNVTFSDGEKVTTDVTGRALFVAPLNPGTFIASIEGRAGHVFSTVFSPEEERFSLPTAEVNAAPRVASLADRFEFQGRGFCGDADANKVNIAGLPALVLASSPEVLAVLPPADLNAGPAQVQVTCGKKTADPFLVVFVNLELEAGRTSLAPGEHRMLTVRVHGSTAKINLEARNLAVDIAELEGGTTARAQSSGGAVNSAKFEVVGRKHGNFLISIRLMSPLSKPRR
jgi:hypothetical protein